MRGLTLSLLGDPPTPTAGAGGGGAQSWAPGAGLVTALASRSPPPLAPAPQMPAIVVLAAAAAAWCFLQVESRHLDALAGGAGPNNGNFLDNDQWLSTVSQYDRDKYWNRFRDVSRAAAGPCGGRGSLSEGASEVGGEGTGADFAGSLSVRGSWASSCLRGTLKRTSKA